MRILVTWMLPFNVSEKIRQFYDKINNKDVYKLFILKLIIK